MMFIGLMRVPASLIPMDDALKSKVMRALERSWSTKTIHFFAPDAAPSYGQCAQTAIVIWETFGGDILKTRGWPKEDGSIGPHYYNRINSTRYDFTAEQFSMPDYSHDVKYDDALSSVAEAETEAEPRQVDELRRAFRDAFNEENAV